MWVTTICDDETIKINTDFITLIYPDDYTIMMASGNELVLCEEDYNELERTMFPKRKTYSKDDSELADFLNELHKLTGGKNEAILTPQRNKKLTSLLQSMSKDQLITAATNIGKDEWLQGANDNKKRYGDVDYLLRPDKAAKWAEVNPADKRKKMF